MRIKSYSMLAALAVGLLFIPSAGNARMAGSLPGFIPFNTHLEGVAVDKSGNVFISVTSSAGSDQIWKFSPRGEPSLLADLGAPGYAAGLAVDAAGNVYLARILVPGHGVYKVSPNGESVLLPGTDQIIGADALAFDQRGTLYVTETFSIDSATGDFAQGGIWRIPKHGPAELWLRHELLTGLPPFLFPFPVGANGIGFFQGALYVINTDKGLVIRIPVLADGSPGKPEIWKEVEDVPESFLYKSPYFPVMLDGLAMDVHGNVYIAVPSRNAIVRVNAADRSQDTIAVFPALSPQAPSAPLDAPLSLTFGISKGEHQSLFITSSGLMAGFVPGVPWTWPGAGLLKIDVGIPGLPLP